MIQALADAHQAVSVGFLVGNESDALIFDTHSHHIALAPQVDERAVDLCVPRGVDQELTQTSEQSNPGCLIQRLGLTVILHGYL
jgi:hypothetical protein